MFFNFCPQNPIQNVRNTQFDDDALIQTYFLSYSRNRAKDLVGVAFLR